MNKSVVLIRKAITQFNQQHTLKPLANEAITLKQWRVLVKQIFEGYADLGFSDQLLWSINSLHGPISFDNKTQFKISQLGKKLGDQDLERAVLRALMWKPNHTVKDKPKAVLGLAIKILKGVAKEQDNG